MANRNTDPIKTLFGREPSMGLRLLVLGILCLSLIALDSRTQRLNSARDVISVAAMPLKMIVDAPRSLSSAFNEKLASRRAMREQLTMLSDERLRLATKLQKMSSLEIENDRMRDLLQSAERLEEEVLMAELLAVELNPNRHQVTLNRGTSNGSFEGQPLIDAQGVIGQVTEAHRYSSTATLLTDVGHAIPVEVNRSGVRSIAQGTGEMNHLRLNFVANEADIKIGDLLVSSGIGGKFPAGYPVAVVESVQRNAGQMFASVSAKPVGQFDRRRRVLLVSTTPANRRYTETRSSGIAANRTEPETAVERLINSTVLTPRSSLVPNAVPGSASAGTTVSPYDPAATATNDY